MQFKSLAIALAVVVAAVSGQTVDTNACSACAKKSVPNEPTCASLPPATQANILTIFATDTPDIVALMNAAKDEAVKTCLCNWATGTFGATGAAAACTKAQGTAPAACTAAQVTEAETKIAPLSLLIQCPAGGAPGGGAPGTGAPGGGNGTSTSAPSKPVPTTGGGAGGSTAPSAASMMTVSKAGVALAAVFGMVAMAGL